MTQTRTLAVIPGDGIGPEVTAEALKVLEAGYRPWVHPSVMLP